METQVLIADDDPSIIRLLSVCLTAAGYHPLVATDGRAALALIREHRPSLVMADWTMPEMDGLDLCRAIRADKSLGFIYLIILTARTDKQEVVQALDAGADDHIAKPFHREELLARLRAGERIVRLEREACERARLESERNRLREAVDAMEKVIGVVGHELRTPLAGIRATIEFLLQPEAKQLGEWDAFLHLVHDEIVRMSDMVNRLLEAACLNSGIAKWNWSTVRFLSLCADAMDTLRPLVAQKGVELVCDVDPPDLSGRGDPEALRRLLINLLANSFKNTDQGSIRISCRCIVEPPATWVELYVTDTGQGIPKRISAGLGQAFALNQGAVGDRHVTGTGLGLAICKGIAAAHGGSMRIESALGRGTTVAVRIRADLEQPSSLASAPDIIQVIAA